jgi:Predicted nucleic acid-binding protein, contains PIN domain
LIADLGPGPTAVDTAAFIYLIEEDAAFLPIVLPLFTEADDGKRVLVTSALTLLEVLVVPYRAGNAQLAERYEMLLTRSRGLRLIDISRDLVRAAAQLRATIGVKTPDALQLAAALLAGCKTFVTNDRRLPAVPGLKVLQLSAYVAK